jgi:ATP-dependent exoDNAse (exonuclease V) alpha subunit
VLGVAVARRAAHELQAGAGIESTSVAALLADLRTWDGARLPDQCVLVVDEAGTLATRQLAALVDAVERARGKLVLVGDHRQLPEIEAGGAFHGLVRRGLAIELTDNRRQVHSWERHALGNLRDGSLERALAAYHTRGRLVFAARDEDVRDRLVSDWWEAGHTEGTLMIAHRRADVAALNERARELMRCHGALGSDALRLPGGSFAIGDRVVVKRNHQRVDVTNGERGIVAGIDPDGDRLQIDIDGRIVTLDSPLLRDRTERGDPTLLHGYAVTAHVAQGMTVDRAFVLARDGLSREWAYTAMSRGREANHLYVGGDELDARAEFAPTALDERAPLERLADALRSTDAKWMAVDVGGRTPRVAGCDQTPTGARVELDPLAPARAGPAPRGPSRRAGGTSRATAGGRAPARRAA